MRRPRRAHGGVRARRLRVAGGPRRRDGRLARIQRRRARRPRRVHAFAPAVLPRPLPGTRDQRPPGAAAAVPRGASDRGRVGGRCAGDGRHGPLRRRGSRHRERDRSARGAGARRRHGRDAARGSRRSSTSCSRVWCASCPRNESADLRLRQGRRRRVRPRACRPRLGDRLQRRHRRPPRGAGNRGAEGRGRHAGAGDARGTGEDAAPADPRGHPRAARPLRRRRHARRARDRAVRPGLRQPLSVRAGGRAPRGPGARGSGDDRHRRAVDAARCREELRARRARLRARAVRPGAGRAALDRCVVARHAPGARDAGVRDDGGVRGGDRALVRGAGDVPGLVHPCLHEGARPLVRREPAPAGGVLRGDRRAHASALPRRPAQRQGAVVQQPQRSLRRRLLVREFTLPAAV